MKDIQIKISWKRLCGCSGENGGGGQENMGGLQISELK